MSHFVFTLESVLQLRIHAEQQCQRDLAAAQAQVVQTQHQLLDIANKINRAQRELRECLNQPPIDPARLAAHSRYQQTLTSEDQRLHAQLQTSSRAADDARSLLSMATAQRKALEKLRARQHDEWRAEQARRERSAHDDLTIRAARSNGISTAET
jgi:flagellar export protein FliJ